MQKNNRKSGFTLVELSIVLIVIGLVLGGVLAGQHLIRAAELRQMYAQVNEIFLQVNTFKLKYNGLPGDLTVAQADQLDFTNATCSGAAGVQGSACANNNGRIDGYGGSCNGQPFLLMLTCDLYILAETATVFTNLAEAGFSYDFEVTYDLPKLKSGNGYLLFGTGNDGMNRIVTGVLTYPASTSAKHQLFNVNGWSSRGAMPVVDAMSMDRKYDDGVPTSGIIMTSIFQVGGWGNLTAFSNWNPCVSSAAPYTYNTANTAADACSLAYSMK